MKDLNIVDVEMNSESIVDESEVLVTLDPGGLSGSSTPPLHVSHESPKKNGDENAFCNSSSSGDEVTSHSKSPPPPVIKVPVTNHAENKGEKEKVFLPLQNGIAPANATNNSLSDKTYNKESTSINVNNPECELDQTKNSKIMGKSAQNRLNSIPSINDFKILKVLGKGAYGNIYQVRKINGPGSGQIYAMKAMNKSRICGSKTDVRHTKAERDVLVTVNKESNPFIVRLHFAFETERRLYLVQEFCCGGELFRRMEFERLMLEKDAIFYLSEIVIALEYLHSKGIVYRDLKTENVMLDKQGHVKLIDFGLSKMNMENDTLTNTFCGTGKNIT
jgi:hypothetical protein